MNRCLSFDLTSNPSIILPFVCLLGFRGAPTTVILLPFQLRLLSCTLDIYLHLTSQYPDQVLSPPFCELTFDDGVSQCGDGPDQQPAGLCAMQREPRVLGGAPQQVLRHVEDHLADEQALRADTIGGSSRADPSAYRTYAKLICRHGVTSNPSAMFYAKRQNLPDTAPPQTEPYLSDCMRV